MANKIFIDPQEFLKTVNSSVEGAMDTFIDNLYTIRKSGGGIESSVPARYNKETGKVVLMDLAQHSIEVGKLLKSGIIPLSEGYIYVDQKAYDTLSEKNLLDGTNGLTFSNISRKITSAPNNLFMVQKSEAITEIQKSKKNDPFVKNVERSGQYYTIEPPNTLLYTSEGGEEIAISALKNYINKTKIPNLDSNKFQRIRVYFTTSSRLTPASHSVLFDFHVRNKLEAGKTEFLSSGILEVYAEATRKYTSHNFDKYTKVEGEIIDTQGAGHLEALKTAETKDILAAFVTLSEDPTIKKSATVYATVLKVIEILEEDLKELDALDKFFSNATAYYHPNLEVYFQNILAGANQLAMDVSFVYKVENKLVTVNRADLNFLFEIVGISTPESSLINSAFKGSRTGAIIAKLKQVWTRAANDLLVELALDKATTEPYKEGSQSLVQAMLTKILAKVFGVNARTNLRKDSKISLVIKNKLISGRSLNLKNPKVTSKITKVRRVSKNNARIGKSPSNLRSTQTQNIVPTINADLKRYVLEQMSYPSLENRSGRFASSVRVLSAQEDAAVQYTYQKSPYQVFSQARGKSPWNDRQERDPAQIIDKAIKRIGMDKFGKVFRTEER